MTRYLALPIVLAVFIGSLAFGDAFHPNSGFNSNASGGSGASSSGASGAVQLSNGSGGFSSDATYLNYDSTNHALGIGSSPNISYALTLAGTYAAVVTTGFINSGASAGHPFLESSGGTTLNFYYGLVDGHDVGFAANLSNVTNSGVALQIGDDLLTYPHTATTAQIAAITPLRAGGLVYNSSISSVCISTGTTLGGFAKGDGATNTTACQ